MVSKPLLKKFQEIIKEDYGKDISLSEAAEIMNGLVGYFDLLAKVDYQEQVEMITSEQDESYV